MMTTHEIAMLLAATWPIGGTVELILFMGALSAVATGNRGALDETFADLARECLERWPPRAAA